jgi:DNA-binding transcriptional LysR family regulator
LSHRIAGLESQLGVTLVHKIGRQAALTNDAETLLAAMGCALGRIEAAIEPLKRRRAQVRLSTVATFASHWLIPRLAAFQSRHPNIEIAISTTTRTIDFDTEDFDCAIRHGFGSWPRLEAKLLFRETLIPVAAPEVANRLTGFRPVAGFGSAPLVRARSRYLDWPVWWQHAGQPGNPPEGGIVVETRAQALDAALAGAGIAMIDMAYIQRHISEGRLTLLAKQPVQLSGGYYFVHRQGSRNARALTALRDWLVEAAQPFRMDFESAP